MEHCILSQMKAVTQIMDVLEVRTARLLYTGTNDERIEARVLQGSRSKHSGSSSQCDDFYSGMASSSGSSQVKN